MQFNQHFIKKIVTKLMVNKAKYSSILFIKIFRNNLNKRISIINMLIKILKQQH